MPPPTSLSPEVIASLPPPVWLVSTDAPTAIRDTLLSLQHHFCVQDLPVLIQQVLNREARSSTATEAGVAFPHARTTTVTAPVLAAGLSLQGIPFGNGMLVHLILAVAIPPDHTKEYLDLIAHLVRQVRLHTMEELLRIRTASEFRQVLAL
ncbi:PTS sugar transporter subunit IIA [Verrucomicrobium spinosum]|uniref:PTS sugar transporter subunit IIA n=1 Tax=Verrucomicrobium spinosum TaxID=2736 RepID=UPI000174564E|nr:PTS sugar transporter subunit IIA [Verrucomicrobium spinosum]